MQGARPISKIDAARVIQSDLKKYADELKIQLEDKEEKHDLAEGIKIKKQELKEDKKKLENIKKGRKILAKLSPAQQKLLNNENCLYALGSGFFTKERIERYLPGWDVQNLKVFSEFALAIQMIDENLLSFEDFSIIAKSHPTIFPTIFSKIGYLALSENLITAKQLLTILNSETPHKLQVLLTVEGLLFLRKKLITAQDATDIQLGILNKLFTAAGFAALNNNLISRHLINNHPNYFAVEVALSTENLIAMQAKTFNFSQLSNLSYDTLVLVLSEKGKQLQAEKLFSFEEILSLPVGEDEQIVRLLFTVVGQKALRDHKIDLSKIKSKAELMIILQPYIQAEEKAGEARVVFSDQEMSERTSKLVAYTKSFGLFKHHQPLAKQILDEVDALQIKTLNSVTQKVEAIMTKQHSNVSESGEFSAAMKHLTHK